MTTSDIDHLFEIIPERRQFIGGYVSGESIFLRPCPREGYLVEVGWTKMTAAGARQRGLALLAAADAAEAAGARIK
jgi:hypothetical protein